MQRVLKIVRSDLFLPHSSLMLHRQHILQQIHHKLTVQEGIPIVVLIGIGGSGKTTLARQYAREQEKQVVWEINAETKESLINSFQVLAFRLAQTKKDQSRLKTFKIIKKEEKRNQNFLLFVKEKLQKNSNWLLLYNNFKVEAFKDMKKYLPQNSQVWGDGQVLITTRDITIKNTEYIDPIQTIFIKNLKNSEMLMLFKNIYYREKIYNMKPSMELQKADIQKLQLFLKQLPPFPLDVSIAAHYIKDHNIQFGEYLTRLQKAGAGFNTSQTKFLNEISDYTKTRYGIITLTLQKLIAKNNDFKDLFLLISVINSKDIPLDIIKFYKGKKITENFIKALNKNSFITNERQKIKGFHKTFSIHRSTQEVIFDYLINNFSSSIKNNSIKRIEKVVKDYGGKIIDGEDLNKINSIIIHWASILNHKSILNPSLETYLHSDLGNMNIYLGNYNTARVLLEKSISLYKKNSLQKHPHFARALGCLGYIDMEEGNYDKATKNLKESISVYEKNSFINHPWLAHVLEYLGNIYKEQGKYKKSKKFFEQSIMIYKKNSLENHPAFARTLGHLGNFYREQGYHKKAQQLLKQSIVIYKKNSLENHPVFARTLGGLGNIYAAQGRYDQATIMLKESISLYKKNSLEDHPWFARTLASLANIYGAQGRYDQSKSMFKESISLYKKNSLENTPDFARALGRLGNIYGEHGNYQKATALLRENIKIYRKNSFVHHPWFASALGRLGNIYKEQGNYKEAKENLKESLAVFSENSFKKNPWIARSLACLGNIYKEQGNYKKAQELLEESLSIYKKHSLENHPWFACNLESLGNVYKEQRKYKMAEKFLKSSLSIYEKNSFKNHSWFAQNLISLGGIYIIQKKYKKARKLLNQSLYLFQKIYGEKHVKMGRIFLQQAKLLLQENKLFESKEEFQKALNIFNYNKHPNTYECFEGLSEIALKRSLQYEIEKKPKQAAEEKQKTLGYLKQALTIADKAFPKDSAHIKRLQGKFKTLSAL